jgi:conjugative transfer signal peptidase TraF
MCDTSALAANMSAPTHIELVSLKRRTENWIRFGQIEEEHRLDHQCRVVSFAAGTVFALVRWASNDDGTVLSRIDILRNRTRRALLEHTLSAPRRRTSAARLRLAESRESPAGNRCRGGPRYRSDGYRAGALAARSQPPVRRRATETLHAQPASSVAPPAEARAMTSRPATMVAMVTAVALLTSATRSGPAPWFVWNASESVPIGLYGVQPADPLVVTSLVVAMPPEPLASFLAQGGYLPRGVPLIKRILALPGQSVCRSKLTIVVDGIEMGAAREHDGHGRQLPTWQGCRAIEDGQVFLMNRDQPESLDGRYFGPISVSAIVGRAQPLWTFEQQ